MDFKEIYLQYGVYKDSILIKATEGYFASDAWMESDAAYADIAGASFGIIAGDDAKQYKESKFNIRRLQSIEEFNFLLDKCHPAFKYMVEKAHSSDKIKVVSEMDFRFKCNLEDHFHSDKTILSVCGCHVFTPVEGGWSHKLLLRQSSNKKEEHNKTLDCITYDTVSDTEELYKLVYKITGYKTADECEGELLKNNRERVTAWEFYY